MRGGRALLGGTFNMAPHSHAIHGNTNKGSMLALQTMEEPRNEEFKLSMQ